MPADMAEPLRVTCAVCGRQVEALTQHRDDYRMCFVLTAYCHGEKDRREVPDVDLHEISPAAMQAALDRGGRAFDQEPRIEGPR